MLEENNTKTVIALGFFDGVHRGHGQLIEAAKARAAQLGVEPAVLSFDVSPMSIVTGKNIPYIITTDSKRDTIERIYGVERVFIYHFDRAIMEMPWRDFIQSLIRRYNAVGLVIGYDFSCGYRGEGNTENIPQYCAEIGVTCDVIPKFEIDGVTVSSTYIRGLISEGDMARANLFLGHPYSVSGTVKDGRGVGRKLGAPTVNLSFEDSMVLPARGVYATKAVTEDGEYAAVTNVGVRPTFEDGNNVTVESFILDFSGNLYGQKVRIEFFDFIRPERKFDSPEELSREIQANAETAKAIIAPILKSGQK